MKVGILLALNQEPQLRTVSNERDIKALLRCNATDKIFLGRKEYKINIYLDKYRFDKRLNETLIAVYPKYPYGQRELAGNAFLVDEDIDLTLDDLDVLTSVIQPLNG